MSDNVIILGAGSSHDAGIPLLAGFVNQIREYASKGISEEGPLSTSDLEVFAKAREVMEDLDKYHGRAEFDDRNIEDILSILSFNIIGGTQTEKDSLNWMIKAISRTIELTCKVKHNGKLSKLQSAGNDLYREFWKNLFMRFNDSPIIPTIVTFNYDLVLERALFQSLIHLGVNEYKFDGLILRYYYRYLADLCYKTVPSKYFTSDEEYQYKMGVSLEHCIEQDLKNPLLLKYLNFMGL